jgi:Putative Ig domain
VAGRQSNPKKLTVVIQATGLQDSPPTPFADHSARYCGTKPRHASRLLAPSGPGGLAQNGRTAANPNIRRMPVRPIIRLASLPMSGKRWCVSALTAAVLVATAAAVAPAYAGGPRTDAVYVALGDSYASGEGLGESAGKYEDGTDTPNGTQRNMCHRSIADAYAVKQVNAKYTVRPAVKATDRSFWACSGATTATMQQNLGALATSNKDFHYKQPQQVASTVGADTRWISISAGGNDIEFAKLVQACIFAYSTATVAKKKPVVRLPGPSCDTQMAASNKDLAGLDVSLNKVYTALLDKAKKSNVVVVGYPRVFPADMSSGLTLKGLTAAQRADVGIAADAQRMCRTNGQNLTYWIGVDDSHARQLTALSLNLNRAALRQVQTLAVNPNYAGRITFADTWSTSVPHNCTGSTPDPSVNGIRFAANTGTGCVLKVICPVSEASFHPTRAGQDRMGKAVEAAFGGALSSLGDSWAVNGKVGEALLAQPILYAGGNGHVTVSGGLDGTIPSWLSLSAGAGTVTLGGTPTAAGSWSFPITVQDTAKHLLSITVTLTVTPGAVVPPPSNGLGKVVADLGTASTAIGFSPGRPLFAYYVDRTDGNCDVRVRNTDNGTDDLVATLARCLDVTWATEGGALLYTKQRVWVWDAATRTSTEMAPTIAKPVDPSDKPTISADGRFVAFDGADLSRYLVDRQSGTTSLLSATESMFGELWAPTGHRVILLPLGACTGVAPACGQPLWPDYPGALTVVADPADRSRLAISGDAVNEAKVIDTDGTVVDAPAALQAVTAWGAGSTVIGTGAYASGFRQVYRWNYRSGELVTLGQVADKGKLAVSPDGSTLLITDTSPTVSVDLATGTVTETALPGDAVSLQWNQTGTVAASAPLDFKHELRMWTAATNTVHTLDADLLCFYPYQGTSASGRYLLVADSSYCSDPMQKGTFKVIDVTTGQVVGKTVEYAYAQSPRVSPWASQGDLAYVYDFAEDLTGVHHLLLVAPQPLI